MLDEEVSVSAKSCSSSLIISSSSISPPLAFLISTTGPAWNLVCIESRKARQVSGSSTHFCLLRSPFRQMVTRFRSAMRKGNNRWLISKQSWGENNQSSTFLLFCSFFSVARQVGQLPYCLVYKKIYFHRGTLRPSRRYQFSIAERKPVTRILLTIAAAHPDFQVFSIERTYWNFFCFGKKSRNELIFFGLESSYKKKRKKQKEPFFKEECQENFGSLVTSFFSSSSFFSQLFSFSLFLFLSLSLSLSLIHFLFLSFSLSLFYYYD